MSPKQTSLRDLLERLYVAEGLGTRAVGARLGASAAKVKRDLAEHGIPTRRPGRPKSSSTD